MYTDLLSFAIALYACWFIYSRKNSREVKFIGRLFPAWVIFYAVYTIGSFFYTESSGSQKTWIAYAGAYLNHFYTLVEFLIIARYFRSIFQSKIFRNITALSISICILFFLSLTITMIEHAQIRVGIAKFYIVECCSLLILCIISFLNEKPSTGNPWKNTHLWATTGITFFCICTLPFSIVEVYFQKNLDSDTESFLYSIYYVFYILMYLLILKGAKLDSGEYSNKKNGENIKEAKGKIQNHIFSATK